MKKQSRTEFLKTCLRVRIFLRDHPESTKEQVHAAIPNADGCLVHLLQNEAATYTGGGKKGPALWSVQGMHSNTQDIGGKFEIIGGEIGDYRRCLECELTFWSGLKICPACREPVNNKA